ncbi:MAG TPA: phosphate ABC transporter substrate-binding protein PstS [Gaiellaceae bacterium]|nr:phosphate ABC transporter substrate-binding protein PstS [Gaiellaceae bacterium]
MLTRPAGIVVLAIALAGCGGSSKPSSTSTGAAGPATSLVGAGSTFVYPLVSSWTGDYATRAGVTITYGAVGSGAGIAEITNRSVDFGASDAPLAPDQVAACKACVQIPWALGGTAVTYNVQGTPAHLKLSGAVIAGMFMGTITRWDDPAIAALNPGVQLPATRVTPVFRADASGTTYNFTDYLSKVSAAWKSKVGVSTQPQFPAGQGAKGSSGVAGVVSHADGAIGYVDVAYAQASHFAYAAVENSAGAFVLPTVRSITAAATAAQSPTPNAAISIVQPPATAASAYPISTFTYVIVPSKTPKAQALKAFLTYAVTTGQAFGPKLLFAPLPSNVVASDRRAIAAIS